MRGFSEALLLVAFTLLPSLFVNGQLRQTSSFKPVRRNSVLRGLLVSRQGVCDPGFVGCEATGCCPVGWNCCVDGNCCDPTTYCALASNGIIGCCDNGEICSGPVGGPTTINGPAPTQPLPPPVPVPTTPTVAPPVPTTPTVPVPTTPTFNSSPPVVNPVPTQTTVNSVPNVVSTPTTAAAATTTTKSSGFPGISSDAGQAKLYRPLLLMLVGVLLAAI